MTETGYNVTILDTIHIMRQARCIRRFWYLILLKYDVVITGIRYAFDYRNL